MPKTEFQNTFLEKLGWTLESGPRISSSIETYQDYIRRSRGEWSVAKSAYVKTHSGWFSERSACYLATGRPVVVQDTGFTDWLKADAGVLPFTTPEEAAAQLGALRAREEAERQNLLAGVLGGAQQNYLNMVQFYESQGMSAAQAQMAARMELERIKAAERAAAEAGKARESGADRSERPSDPQ